MLKQCIVFCMRDKSWSIILIRATLPMLSRRRIGARAKGKNKKAMVPLYLMMAPLESSASFRASEALQRFTKKKKKQKKKKERKRKKRRNNEKEKKKKKQQRYSNIACWERRAIACRFFLFLERKTTNISVTNKFRIERPGQFSAIFFFLLFIFVLFILFNYRIVRFALRVFFIEVSFLWLIHNIFLVFYIRRIVELSYNTMVKHFI